MGDDHWADFTKTQVSRRLLTSSAVAAPLTILVGWGLLSLSIAWSRDISDILFVTMLAVICILPPGLLASAFIFRTRVRLDDPFPFIRLLIALVAMLPNWCVVAVVVGLIGDAGGMDGGRE